MWRAAQVELDHGLARRQEVPVGEVGADQEQRVAAVEGDVVAWLPISPDWPDLVGVVAAPALLGLQGQHHRRGEPVGQLQHLVPGMPGALADERVTAPAALSAGGRRRDGLGVGRRRPVGDERGTAVSFGRSSPPTSPGRVSTATPRSWRAALPACSMSNGSWSMLVTVSVEDRDVGEERVVVDLLEEVAADLLAGHLAADGEHRGVRLLRVVQAVEQVDRARARPCPCRPRAAR